MIIGTHASLTLKRMEGMRSPKTKKAFKVAVNTQLTTIMERTHFLKMKMKRFLSIKRIRDWR